MRGNKVMRQRACNWKVERLQGAIKASARSLARAAHKEKLSSWYRSNLSNHVGSDM